MNEVFVIEFIRQRMAQLGVTCYHFEPLFMLLTSEPSSHKLDNEIWYLVGRPLNVRIESDTAYYFNTAAKAILLNPPEFTGHVTVSATVENTPVGFVRVIIQND